MKTSGSCLVNRSPGAPRTRWNGYSLVELLAVLALLGAVSGLVFPRLVSIYDSFQRQSELEAVLGAVDGLGRRAFSEQRTFTLGASAEANRQQLGLGEDWTVIADVEIRWRANGVCDGGELQIGPAYGERKIYRLEPPFCRPSAPKPPVAGDTQ